MVFPCSYGKWPTYRSLINWVLLYLSNMVIFHMLKNRMVFFSLYWPSSVVGPLAAKKQMRLILRWHLANPLEMEVFYWGKLENIYKWWIFRCFSIIFCDWTVAMCWTSYYFDDLRFLQGMGCFIPWRCHPTCMEQGMIGWLIYIYYIYTHSNII